MIDYEIREKILQHMGFSDYEEYRTSRLWRDIRLRVLDRDRYICTACQVTLTAKSGVVHHNDYLYETLAGLVLDGMVAICRPCHDKESAEDLLQRRELGARKVWQKNRAHISNWTWSDTDERKFQVWWARKLVDDP